MHAEHVAAALREESPDFIVLAPGYPQATSNGGEFIRTRVRGYVAAGLQGHVFDYRAPSGSQPYTQTDGAVPVTVSGADLLAEVMETARSTGVPVLAHSPTPEVSRLLRAGLPGRQVAVWYHGYEVRDYRRLSCNYTTTELDSHRSQLDAMNRERFGAAAEIFAEESITKVFVSDFQRRYSEWDVGVAAENALIIPNHIDTDHYRARVRGPEDARRILLMRSFSARNYANDVAMRAIELLAGRRGFEELEITVRGFGRYFTDEVRDVRRMRNVDVAEVYSGPAEMAMLHFDNGIFLCPSRYDTQGVMLGEAMASGMVTVTNPVAAIGEYTDTDCSLLPRADDPWAFAEAIWYAVTHPQIMEPMSRNAAVRVQRQCGQAATLDKEIELIGRLGA